MSPEVRERNIKRLRRNVQEYNRKLADIETAWPYGAPSKAVQTEYDDLYSLYIEDSKALESLEREVIK